jgi:hypothetical protein
MHVPSALFMTRPSIPSLVLVRVRTNKEGRTATQRFSSAAAFFLVNKSIAALDGDVVPNKGRPGPASLTAGTVLWTGICPTRKNKTNIASRFHPFGKPKMTAPNRPQDYLRVRNQIFIAL